MLTFIEIFDRIAIIVLLVAVRSVSSMLKRMGDCMERQQQELMAFERRLGAVVEKLGGLEEIAELQDAVRRFGGAGGSTERR